MTQVLRSVLRWAYRGYGAMIWVVIFEVFFRGSAYCQIFSFRSYGVRQGLLSNGVTTLCQDSNGYLWIGTSDGLSSYDGEIFKNYTVVDGLASSWVNCIVEDCRNKDIMWIATLGGGISEFHDGAFSNYRLGNNPWSNIVTWIAQGKDGTLYCATDRGVFSLAGGRASVISSQLAELRFLQVAIEGDSLVLLDDRGELLSYNFENHRVSRIEDRWTRRSKVSRFLFGSRNRLWLSMADGSLIDFTNRKAIRRATSQPANCIFEDREGNLWVCTNDGLYEIDEKDFGRSRPRYLTTRNGLPNDGIWTGLCDSEGDIWLGVGADGLCKLTDPNTCLFETPVPVTAIDNSQAAADQNGHIWVISTRGMLEIWRKKTRGIASWLHSFRELDVQKPEYSFRITSGSIMWLCSADGVFRRFKIRSAGRSASELIPSGVYSMKKYFRHGEFLCFMVDREDRIWCSFNNTGLVVLDTEPKIGGRMVRSVRDDLPDNSIRAMYEDGSGDYWFGGYIGGLVRLHHPFRRDYSSRLYKTDDGLADNSVRAITQDDSGKLWIGTRFGGLSILRNGKFENISAGNGLLSNGVWSFFNEGAAGMLVGTQLGLESLRRESSGQYVFHEIGERTPVFSVGLSSTNLRWICSSAGTAVTVLVNKTYRVPPPGVRVTRFLANGEELPLAHNPELSYNRNTITFVFAGISLRNGRNLSYRYSLSGVDNGWRYAPHAHAITYVSLKPGNYTFRVRAVEPSGIESTDVASLSFAIVPPYWQRWWFILGIVVSLGSIVYTVLRVRIDRLLEIERVRSRIATDLHDDIGSGLTRIAVMAEVAARQTETNVPQSVERAAGNGSDEGYSPHKLVERIGANARELVGSMSDVVWSVDPKNMTMGDLLKRLRSFAFEISEAKGVEIEFIVDGKIETIRVDPQILRALLLISKEGLNNAIKYSRCKKVSISVRVNDKCIRLRLSDDGCGFDGANQTGGHGLQNMRSRAEKLGGVFSIDSSPGNGTTIDAELPFYA